MDRLRKLARRCRLGTMALGFIGVSALAQRPPDIPLDSITNRSVVEGVIKMINRYYVSPDVASKVESELRNRLAKGEYDEIKSAFDLMDVLDDHLQKASGDAHLKVAYSHRPGNPIADGQEVPRESPEDWEEDRVAAQRRNFGFERVERLPGNVGLLDMRAFVRPAFAGETVAAAMTFLTDVDAMIIDLRNSRGGSPDMVVFLASYFFPIEDPVHLLDWYCRPESRPGETWTERTYSLPYVPGSRHVGTDLYILVSRKSFSAVEGFATVMQHHQRATIVGERTAGGTHPGNMIQVHPHFAVFVPMCWPIYPTGEPAYPMGRAFHREFKTDREGTGVKPDIEVSADQALKVAHLEAMKKQVERYPDRKESLDPIIDGLKAELNR